MENFEEPQTEQEEVLIITEDIRSYIYETAKWAKFLSIVGLVLSGLMVLGSFTIGTLAGAGSKAMGPGMEVLGKIGGGALTVMYLLIALLYFYPSLLLLKYANAAKTAILYTDQASLSLAMQKMKSLFKFWGIFTIVIIAFYAMAILLLGAIGVGAAVAA